MDEARIREILHEHYALEIQEIEFLRESGGACYVVRDAAQKYLLKIAGEAFWETVKQSVEIMRYLRGHDFPVPEIMETTDGALMLECVEEEAQRLFILYEFIEGGEPDIFECAEEIGALTGRFHRLMDSFDGELVTRDKQFFVERYIDILRKKEYPRIEAYCALGDTLWERVKNQSCGGCHGDLHRGNLLLTPEGQLYVLDFDTVCRAPRMFDIAVMCDVTDYFDLRTEDVEKTMAVYSRFLKAYMDYASLPGEETASFWDWVAIRHFQLQATIVECFGPDCIDHHFIDRQMEWLRKWNAAGNKE